MAMNKQAWNKDFALKYFLLQLNNNFEKPNLLTINKFGHALIKTVKGKHYYFIYKKDFFNAFSNIFKEYCESNNSFGGVGESINIEYMKLCLNKVAEPIWRYESYPHVIYQLDSEKLAVGLNLAYPSADFSESPSIAMLKIYCDFHKLFRVQDKTNEYKVNDYAESTILVNEQTYSFPVKLLKRW